MMCRMYCAKLCLFLVAASAAGLPADDQASSASEVKPPAATRLEQITDALFPPQTDAVRGLQLCAAPPPESILFDRVTAPRTVVKKHLQITASQVDELTRLLRERQAAEREASRPSTPGSASLSWGDHREIQGDRWAAAFEAVLTRKQLARYDALLIQYEGFAALRRPTLARRFGLTEVQRREIDGVLETYLMKAHDASLLTVPRTRPETRQGIRDLQRRLDVRVLSVLDETQLARIEKCEFSAKW